MLNGAGWPSATRFAPHGVVVGAVGELDQVEGVLDVRIELIEWHELTGFELARHAAVEDRQRRGADVFGQVEVLVEAEAERLVVVGRRAPGNSSFQRLTISLRSDGSPIVFFHW